jgi:hypothetical protein
MKRKSFLAGLVSLLLLAACATPPEAAPTATSAPTPAKPADLTPVTNVRYHFVSNKLLWPTTGSQAQTYALDIDGDSHPDNLFGRALATLGALSPGLDLQSTVDQVINAGQVVMLHAVQTGSPGASWSVFNGQRTLSPPKFDGSDQFALDPAAPTDSVVTGSMTNSHFAGGPGTARVQIIVLGVPVQVDLIGVRIEADVSKTGCTNGKLGGGITDSQFQATVLPALAAGLNQIIASDKGCPVACGTPANILLQALDADKNGTITVEELQNNILLKAAISPDLDLLDASGKFSPRQDGVKDSLSVGLGFTCVPATFKAPGD